MDNYKDAVEIKECKVNIDLSKLPDLSLEQEIFTAKVAIESLLGSLKTKEKALEKIFRHSKEVDIRQIAKDALNESL